MTEEKPGVIWLVCPKCKLRYEARAAVAAQSLRCKECRTELRKVKVVDADDLIGDVDPDLDLPATAAPTAPVYSENVLDVVKLAEAPPLPERRRMRPEPERRSNTDEEYKAPKFTQLSLGTILWAFFSNTLAFPFNTCALLQWITITFQFAILSIAASFVAAAFMSGQEGLMIIAGFGIVGFARFGDRLVSYAPSSMDAVIVNTAYQLDDESRWPDSDPRERVFDLLRWAVILTFVILMAAGVASLTDYAWHVFWPVFLPLVVVLFPIALMSSLEAASLSPFSWNVLRSIVKLPHVWLLFYLMSGAIGFGCGWLGWFTFKHLGLFGPAVAAPVFGAAALIFARLLGRLAWCFLKSGNAQNVGEKNKRVGYGTPE
jgi:hypothetical protein